MERRPVEVRPSGPDFEVECLPNPGAFRHRSRIGLAAAGGLPTLVLDPDVIGGVRVLRYRRDDPDLQASDPRISKHRGQTYLSTLSHLRFDWSDDGVRFTPDPAPAAGAGVGRAPATTSAARARPPCRSRFVCSRVLSIGAK